MTSVKARGILTLMGTPDFKCSTEDIIAARKLGAEALKRLSLCRSYGDKHSLGLLPGENIR